MDETKLKPCPFCGREPEEFQGGLVNCEYHGANIFPTPIFVWNTRPIEDAQAKRIAELEAKITDLLHQEHNPWFSCDDILPALGVEVEVYAAPFYARGKRTEYPDRVLWGCGFEPTHWREIVLPK